MTLFRPHTYKIRSPMGIRRFNSYLGAKTYIDTTKVVWIYNNPSRAEYGSFTNHSMKAANS